jgi:3-oxoacyl-[acyl-carrier protein] reductase
LEAKDLNGLRALVTGASGGIGSATARLLAKRGAHVCVHYNSNPDGARTVVEAITAAGGKATTVGGDVVDDADAILLAAAGADSRIDILVNNAGTLQEIPFGKVTKDNFSEQFHANVLGMIMISQAAVPFFPTGGGQIVNVATNMVYGPLAGANVYTAAKAAIISLTRGFANELGERRITMNAVAPGATDTPMISWVPDDIRNQVASATPLGRLGQPNDVAQIIAFLASPASRWVNGRTIIVDGGLI